MHSSKIILERNTGFRWTYDGEFSFKGYLYKDGRSLSGTDATAYLKYVFSDGNNRKERLSELNGVFSIVRSKAGKVFACCDRMRSFPFFYYFVNGELVITDDPVAHSPEKEPDNESVEIFLHTGYVTGEKSLIKDLFQIQAGEYISAEGPLFKREFYHRLEADELGDDEKTLKEKLVQVINEAGKDMCTGLKGRTAVVPLSSGYDSRLIAVLLKMNGITDVITYTYGRKGNRELYLSERVARSLGYEWKFVEYNEESLRDYLSSDEFKSYYPFAAGYTSMFYLQEYFALKELKDHLPAGSVIIPGHSGDTIAGSHLSENILYPASKGGITDRIISKHFNMKEVSPAERVKFEKMLSSSFGKKVSHLDYENWILKERHGKFIINSNRIYDFFGYEYLMPLVDSRFMDFFCSVPPFLKSGKKLYDEVLRDSFFSVYGLNFENETNPGMNERKIQNSKNALKNMLPKKIINFYKEKLRKNSDIYYNIGVTDIMIEDMKSSGTVPDMTGENRNSIIIQWYIHKLLNRKI